MFVATASLAVAATALLAGCQQDDGPSQSLVGECFANGSDANSLGGQVSCNDPSAYYQVTQVIDNPNQNTDPMKLCTKSPNGSIPINTDEEFDGGTLTGILCLAAAGSGSGNSGD